MNERVPSPSAPVQISSGELTIVTYPAHGFVISAITPVESGVNLLWERPDAPLHDLGSSVGAGPAIEEFDESVFAGGWFTMFPLAGIPGDDDDLPMHGAAPRVAWDIVTVTETSVTCRVDLELFALERTVAVAGRTIEVSTRAHNRSNHNVAITFGEHPCLSREAFAGGRVVAEVDSAWITAEASEPAATRFAHPQTFRWPLAERRGGGLEDVSVIPDNPDGRHDHLCISLSGAEIRVTSPRLGGTLTVRTDIAVLTHLLLWQHFRPALTPWSGDVFALELCSAPGRTLDDAREVGKLVELSQGDSVEWAVIAQWDSHSH